MEFTEITKIIRNDLGLNSEVPEFDPENGNEDAKFLFLLEAPGPKAIKTGLISFNNPDPSAKNFKKQVSTAGIDKRDIALWNVVPWYIGNENQTLIRSAKTSDIEVALKYLKLVIAAMKSIKCIILVGGAARKTHVALSSITTVRIFSCHHPSAKVLNSYPKVEEENLKVFRNIIENFG
ncbi:MAG: uracil-DNA glycosylase [Desulfobulbaceae bacterium]|nr:uracil-DNA glycosylase [Desulfobulbaceae bacterium]